ncbi:hypothetical protein ANN_06348 [Periplaneta americana]|uniref:Uncharacterized protein n=1 Tax=Periplaneta americana TaxID=6978 RepID=A0ABQ8TDA6_PERAM|nr:hypothetical protein ANN_06348 [Periplaneta americana]
MCCVVVTIQIYSQIFITIMSKRGKSIAAIPPRKLKACCESGDNFPYWRSILSDLTERSRVSEESTFYFGDPSSIPGESRRNFFVDAVKHVHNTQLLKLEYAIRKVQDNREDLELNGLHQLLVYTDNVKMLGENSQTIRKNTGILLEASKGIGLEVNPEKTKYMIMSRDKNIVENENIKIVNLSFEKVFPTIFSAFSFQCFTNAELFLYRITFRCFKNDFQHEFDIFIGYTGCSVSDMANDIQDIMKDKIKSSQKFSLQIDESTDISGHAQLLSYIRYIDGDVIAIFLCKLPERATDEEMFRTTNEYVVGRCHYRRCSKFHLLLEYTPHIDVSLTCEHDPKLQEYCVCPQNMPQFDSEGIPNQAPDTNKPVILNGPTSRNREGSDQVSVRPSNWATSTYPSIRKPSIQVPASRTTEVCHHARSECVDD